MRLGYKITIGCLLVLLLVLSQIEEFKGPNIAICIILGLVAFVCVFMTYLDPKD